MKNFKKVIAFLMVAAMTLGMGLTAFASEAGDQTTEELFKVGKIEAGKAGDTVQIELIAARDLSINGVTIVVSLDPEYVVATEESLQNIEANGYTAAFGYDTWQMSTTGSGSFNETYETNGHSYTKCFVQGGIGTGKAALATAGTTVMTLNVELAKDLAGDETIATISLPIGVTDDVNGVAQADGKKKLFTEDIPVVVSAAEIPSSSESSSESSSSATATTPSGTNATGGTAAADNNNNAAGNNNNNNNAAQPTTKALPKADDIKTVTSALEACADLIENGKYDAVLNIAKKLDASCFTSADNYNKFAAALKDYEAVLGKQGATDQEKIDAYNKMIELMQENVLTQKGKDTLMTNVKAALSSTPATTKAGNGKTKTGDTAPVAALIIVAIAAFGTAVVVYRKKVNA